MINSLPQAVELELAVLGALITDQNAIDDVIDILTADCFYDTKNGLVFRAISDLYASGSPIDLLTVVNRLKATKTLDAVGGVLYVTQLTDNVVNSVNVEFHSRIIVQQYLKRKLIEISTLNGKGAYDDSNDVFDLYAKSIQQLEGAISGVIKYDVSPINQIHEKVIAESRAITVSGAKSGVPSCFNNIDNFTNGWQKTDLIILAGRPAMGKSVCGLTFALKPALRDNIPTVIFSLEMSKEQLVGRAQSILSEIDSSRIIKKQLTLEEIDAIENSCGELKTAPIYIDDTPALSLMELKGKARKLVRDKGVQLIVIDYLQLMTVDVNKNSNREQEVGAISKGLKNLAKELNIPIIALSQLNRAVESRADKKPLLSDLRESGNIEQDADMVIFCYRPEYYGIPQYEMGSELLHSENLMVLILAKHRSGTLGELRLGFNGVFTKLENYETLISKKILEDNPFKNEMKPNPDAMKDDLGFIDDNPF
jgi:replicative DNA helicase